MRIKSFGENKYNYLDWVIFLLRSRHIINHLKDINGPLKALDIGCGFNPTLLEKIIKTNDFSSLIGIDLSINQKYKHNKIRLIRSNQENKLPLNNNKFDVVFSTAVIEHLNNYNQALEEIFRVLKPNGFLYLTTPDPLSKPLLEFLAKTKIISNSEIEDHKQYFNRNNLKEIFIKIGFKKIKIKKLIFGLNNLYICKK